MGQNVEPYFQEVLATLEQSAEEGGKGEGKALRSRIQQLYSEIVADTDSGRSFLKQSTAKRIASVLEAQLLYRRHKSNWKWDLKKGEPQEPVISEFVID